MSTELQNMTDNDRPAFWDRACRAYGHTGYGDPLLHRYDQPVRLATIGRVLNRLFPRGLAGRSALDIGCGTGDFIGVLRGQGAKVIGIDISSVVIDATRNRYAGDPDVSLQVGAIRDLSVAPASLDVITSVTVMQHVTDDEEFVRSLRILRTALRPDGRMVLLELSPPHSAAVPIRDSAGYVYLKERPRAGWQAAFGRAGLKLIAEPVFPQLGITLLRGLSRTIMGLRAPHSTAQAPAATADATSSPETPSVARRLKRSLWRAVRQALLLLAWPLDHILHLPLPAARFRYYRIFVVQPSPEVLNNH